MEDLHDLRAKLLRKTLRIVFIPAVIGFFIGSFQELAYNEKGAYTRVFAVYLPLIVIFAFTTFLQKVPNWTRSGTLILILTIIGLSELYYFGLASMGMMMFSGALLFGTVFHNFRTGLFLVLIFNSILLGIGSAYEHGIIPINVAQQEASLKLLNWLSPIAMFTTIGGGVMTVISILLNGLSDSLVRMQESEGKLAKLNVELEIKIKDRTKDIQALYDAAQNELKFAAMTQKSILLKSIPQLNSWDIAVTYQPLQIVSGDVYDFYYEGSKLVGVCLFDVSGHGVASGLLTLMARSVARKIFFENKNCDLGKVMDLINEVLIKELNHVEYYLTGVLLRFTEYQDEVFEVEYANAAHPDLLFKDKQNNTISRPFQIENIKTAGSVLGFAVLSDKHITMKLTMKKEDSLLLFSDGILDTLQSSESRTSYGMNRLQETLLRTPYEIPATEQLQYIMGDLDKFRNNAPFPDDITAILIKKI
ncbi:MAG: PP2C family protein-serine/threonine phosphatase [Spirochaetota bacterium]